MKAVVKETDLARPVVEWFKNLGFEVYQEVQIEYAGPRADIVAWDGTLLWIVEVKTSLSFAVIEQAFRWQHSAHRVSVAVPVSQGSSRRRGALMQERCLRREGIGLFRICLDSYSGDWSNRVRENIKAPLNRKARARGIVDRLQEEHKESCPAGSNGGGYWTPFAATCRSLIEHVRKNPGCAMKEAIESINHHYASTSSARSALSHWLREGVIEGIEMRRNGRKLNLYLKGES